MFIKFDFKCPCCGTVETRFVRRSEVDLQTCGCRPMVETQMLRLPAGTRTTFRFADVRLKR